MSRAALGTRRSTWNRPRGRKGLLLIWLKRFGFTFGALVLLGWLGAWLYLSGSFAKAANWAQQQTLAITADMGFQVQDILVEGRVHTDPDILLGIVNAQKGDPLFAFDPDAARELIEKISWVKSVRIERRLPGTIYIGLEERVPLALWMQGEKLVLIDKEGAVLTDHKLSRFKQLVLLTGEEAPKHAPELLGLLAAEPLIHERTESAAYIGNRRWDLKLENDLIVRLPENDIGLALRRLAAAQEEDGLLEKDITAIDLRETGRIIVRTRPGAVQDYQAGLKTGKQI